MYVNFGTALWHFSNTTTLVLLTLMTNCCLTHNSNRASICFCNPCGVSDINAKSSAYNSNLTTMSANYGGLSPSSAFRCFSSPSRYSPKSSGLSGQPCLTPMPHENRADSPSVGCITLTLSWLYMLCRHCMKRPTIPILASTCHSRSRGTVSKAL